MALGRPKVALILTDDERVRLDSLAHRSRTAPHAGAARADHPGVRGGARQQGRRATPADVAGHGVQMARAVCSRATGRVV